MSHVTLLPIANPYLLHIAYGAISPKITMKAVEMAKPSIPLVRSASRILIPALTATFPTNSVHNNKFPLSRIGRILVAYFVYSAVSSFS